MSYKILLLDDDERFRKVVLAGLRSKDVEVTEAANGADAFSALKNVEFDLLIIDGMLPDTDGISWIRKYRADGGSSPIMFISAQWQSVETYHMLTRELQVALIIHKPVIPAVLAEQVYSEVSRPKSSLTVQKEEEYDPTMDALSKEYLAQVPEELHEIHLALNQISQNGLNEQDLQTMRLYSHKIRGTAGTFGFDELGFHMGEMEDSIKAHLRAPGIDERNFLKQLHNSFEKAKLALRNYEHPEETETRDVSEFKSLSCILVADQDPDFVSSVERIARQRFVDVLIAKSAKEVLHLLSSRSVDAILIDAKMAEDKSSQLIKNMREITGEQIPIAFVSEQTDLDERLTAPHLGASLYLTKPIDPDSLEDAIQRLNFLGSKVRPKVLIVDDDIMFARRVSAV
jgi:DNA-binding response OmpR family regulator